MFSAGVLPRIVLAPRGCTSPTVILLAAAYVWPNQLQASLVDSVPERDKPGRISIIPGTITCMYCYCYTSVKKKEPNGEKTIHYNLPASIREDNCGAPHGAEPP
eukprot:GHVU01232341.1.p1 GENE.GHVU01232341.1~~GHVU01232341.1.p1  ORF type:complete len:104 (-),score=1.32 GHVU01232341.1:170-481(-)